MSGGSHVGAIRGLFAAGLDAVKTRLDLAAVEIELYLLRAVQMVLLAVAALACALLGLVFGLVSIVVALWDTHRMAGLIGGTVLFLVLAAVAAWLSARTFRSRPPLLDGTIQQLEHDQRSARGVP
ncbi:MAG TPA: phage holin family protein [Steroidobacteraceae bacterium]|nr:phage holin family protein [Steroidobacteraceae bacterium]